MKQVKKSTWKEFINSAKIGLEYSGAIWNDNFHLSIILNKLDKDGGEKMIINRVYKSGTKNICFSTPDGTNSYINKVGKVLIYQNFYIIVSDLDEDNTVYTIYKFR